jgi:predicted acetyltransferase
MGPSDAPTADASFELVAATLEDEPVVRNLSEYYVYDFSELLGFDVGNEGRFGGDRLRRHFEDPLCHPFLLRCGGKLAGFAIHEGRSRFTGEAGTNDFAELFVMRKYRKLGLGARAAIAVFDRFAGPWEVRQVRGNVAATAFWRKVIDRYTAGRYDEVERDDEGFRGVVQRFAIPPLLRDPR